MRGFARLLAVVLFVGGIAHASAGLILAKSLDSGLSRITSSGHSAVYLSRVCPDGPVHLRLCAPGEQGSVINNYDTFTEDKAYEWNIIPLSVYLYGVEDPNDRPLYASPELRTALQDQFRDTRLKDLCPEGPCRDAKAHWRDLIATTFVRDLYMFEVDTTLEQDEAFIAKFNAAANVNHYNGFKWNCADFASLVINTYFPGSARADHINDFWMTSPKAIAKSFTHYAVKRPDLHLRVVRYTQIPGSYRRSDEPRKGTEVMFTTKKWFFPMLFRYDELIGFTSAYMLTGRFNPELELHRRPTEAATAAMAELEEARKDSDYSRVKEEKSLLAKQRAEEFGTKDRWATYSEALREMRSDEITPQAAAETRTAKAFANDMDAHGRVEIDSDGRIWVDYGDGDRVRRVGVSASNVNAPASDSELAFSILLVRANEELTRPSRNRESLPEFQADWQLLQGASRNLRAKALAGQPQEPSVAGSGITAQAGGSRLLP